MRFNLVFWALLFVLGALAGDRYGIPGFLTSITDRGFESVESWLGRFGEPVSETEEPIEPVASAAAPETAGATSTRNEPTTTPGASNSAANANLRINDAGLQIIEESEGLRLEAYSARGRWYIGYGHSRTAQAGMTITEAEAERLLREDVRASENAIKSMVKVPMNENQFSAMVSLAYNLGSGGFSRSTVLERINKGDYAGAADAFLNHNRAGGVPNEHLTQRREKERTLFLTPA